MSGLAAVSRVAAVSSVYETIPIGGPDQGPFLNAVVVVDTARTPRGLLRELLLIERSLGRVRDTRWGPRTLDLDLILWNDQEVSEPGLTIPHPRMKDRRFVLEPLLEVWPGARMPDGSAITPSAKSVEQQGLERVDVAIGGADDGGT
jgi:dihydroneopterin aldolase/2-amino-4-hydroxy-6-hydroxymethyldihydropteridine diphosphokinase